MDPVLGESSQDSGTAKVEEEAHSCDGGNFEEWNQAKQHWCCYKKGIACDPFNCKVLGCWRVFFCVFFFVGGEEGRFGEVYNG